MRHSAILFSFSLLIAACSSATGPSVDSASSTMTPAPNVATASPALVTPAVAPTGTTTVRVLMGDNFFTPDAVAVAVGTTVEWYIGSGEQPHDVIAVDGSFRSHSPMNRGDVFSSTFTKAGEHAYVCTFHIAEGMIGKVIVR